MPWLVKNVVSLAILYVALMLCVILMFQAKDIGVTFVVVGLIALALGMLPDSTKIVSDKTN